MTKKESIESALRRLVGAIYKECKGAYGADDEGYGGEFENEIKDVAKSIIDLLQPTQHDH